MPSPCERGGVSYSTLGGTHHAQEDIAVVGAIPNMAVLAPCDPLETEAATWVCAERNGPTYLRLGKAGEPNLTTDAPEPFEFGKVRLIREGKDVCIISYGPIMKMAWEIAERIEREQGRTVALVSAHTVKPLDRVGVKRILDRFETVAVIEEHSPRGSLGGEVKQLAWDASAKCRLVTFSLRDAFIHQFGSQRDMWTAHGLDPEIIYQSIVAG